MGLDSKQEAIYCLVLSGANQASRLKRANLFSPVGGMQIWKHATSGVEKWQAISGAHYLASF